jgi:ribosomal-protein-alanine N-acetyltransferase
MSIAVSLVIDYAFADLKLKKIEAFVHQENLASIKLLEKFDFNFTKIIQEEHIVSKEMSPLHVYQKINHLL